MPWQLRTGSAIYDDNAYGRQWTPLSVVFSIPGLNVTQESNESLPQLIILARDMVHPRLARFARQASENCQEVYLFRGEIFCGVRFALGSFRADWDITESQICVYRGTHEIDRINLIPDQARRAA